MLATFAEATAAKTHESRRLFRWLIFDVRQKTFRSTTTNKIMIRVSVLYPRKDGARFDWAYYTGTHVPLVGRRLGSALKAVAIEQGIAGGAPGSPAAFVAIANLTFDSVPAFEAAFGPHANEIMTDIPKYTSIEPIIQISEVKIGT